MSLPPAAYAATLAGFEAMTVQRLRALLTLGPEQAHAVAGGAASPPPGGLVAKLLADPRVRVAWERSAGRRSPAEVWRQCRELAVDVLVHGAPAYPASLAADRLPPPVLFVLGDAALLSGGRRVAIVGTRNATAAGRHAANSIAGDLGRAGVHVVSGLARGIDGAAHGAVLEAAGGGRPIGVVASGHDVVYPREHRALWRSVAQHGVLISEWPPGTQPEAYRFPLRNRIIAALSEIVVVVESRATGGSLITADEAVDRGIPVMAVPGAIHNRAADGTNDLMRDGAAPVVDASDVLRALAIDHRRCDQAIDQRPRPRADDRPVYLACAERPRTIDELAAVTSSPLVDVAMSLARLEQSGWIMQTDGWYEAVGPPLR